MDSELSRPFQAWTSSTGANNDSAVQHVLVLILSGALGGGKNDDDQSCNHI